MKFFFAIHMPSCILYMSTLCLNMLQHGSRYSNIDRACTTSEVLSKAYLARMRGITLRPLRFVLEYAAHSRRI